MYKNAYSKLADPGCLIADIENRLARGECDKSAQLSRVLCPIRLGNVQRSLCLVELLHSFVLGVAGR